jgi:lysyl-tRNA synthetase, class II
VTFVASLLIVEAVVVVLSGAALATTELAQMPAPTEVPESAFESYVGILPGLGLATVIVVAGGGLALASVGLMHLREWAWTLAMALQGVGLANALYDASLGQPSFVTLGVGSFVVLVLNQREVRQAFDLRHEHG